MALTLYSDLISHCLDYMLVDPSAEADRVARRAVQAAINTIPQMRRWAYYYSPLLINTNASQTSSTITFDYTGGASERMVTIASGTWPSWAALGVLRISSVDYEVATRESSTVLTLSRNSNPGEDVAAGTSYTLFRNQYPLPTDFLALGDIINRTNKIPLQYIAPNEWQQKTAISMGPQQPFCYTIMGSRNYVNTMTLFLWPPPGSAYTLDGVYQRRMRPVLVQGYTTGTVTASAASTTVTGSGTAFTSNMVGSVMRFGTSTTDPPTGVGGTYPFTEERIITAVASSTGLTVDAVPSQSYTATKFTISDPVDIFEGAMLTFLLRECERQVRILRRINATSEERLDYEAAKVLAFESDCPVFGEQVVGIDKTHRFYEFYKLPSMYYGGNSGDSP